MIIIFLIILAAFCISIFCLINAFKQLSELEEDRNDFKNDIDTIENN